jgi:putative FmdB family regulatory protein
MPLYEYECDACGERFEVIQKFSDESPETCRLCSKGPVRRLVSAPAIQFKGEGWYVTDYAGKGKPDAASSERVPSKSDDGKASDKKDGATSDGAIKSAGGSTKDSGSSKDAASTTKTTKSAKSTKADKQ